MDIVYRSQSILERMCANPQLGPFLDTSLKIPAVYRGSGEIKLVVLGQDPTVKNPRVRKHITCALNLNKAGSLKNYLTRICWELGIELSQNVYATNLYKNFFIDPPTQITDINIFSVALPYWLPLLKEELAEFPFAKLITLGEPILSVLVNDPQKAKLRDYWGYLPGWKHGDSKDFSFIPASGNLLGRPIFPFPHQPSLRKIFYQERLIPYLHFMKYCSVQ